MHDDEVAVIAARLREELQGGRRGEGSSNGLTGARLLAREDAERFWAVSAERPFLSKPGVWGTVRGLLLSPPKLVLRRLMRWYVEPAFSAQREFNAAMLRTIDQLRDSTVTEFADLSGLVREASDLAADVKQSGERVNATAEQLVTELEERLTRVERKTRAPAAPAPAAAAPAPTPPAPVAMPDYFAFESRMRGSTELVRERQREYVDSFRNAAPVLDIGCGRGEFLGLLAEAGVEARGIDLDEDMVAYARGAGHDVEQADAITYLEGVPAESLGGVFCSHVVEHLQPPAIVRLLELAADRIRPGGTLVAETPNPRTLGILPGFFADLTHAQPLHPETLALLARQCGFEAVELRFFREFPAEERLREVALPDEAEFDEAQTALRSNVDRLNETLFGPRDYAIIARR
jgi:2-polyprenyl-3-methyl-5-hydroxy-6-metoxy-1,4-benzoquinol methylase